MPTQPSGGPALPSHLIVKDVPKQPVLFATVQQPSSQATFGSIGAPASKAAVQKARAATAGTSSSPATPRQSSATATTTGHGSHVLYDTWAVECHSSVRKGFDSHGTTQFGTTSSEVLVRSLYAPEQSGA